MKLDKKHTILIGFAVILVLILVEKHRLTEWKKMRLA